MKQCLIIDDSPVIRKVARLIVEQINFEATEAQSADQALELCDSQLPDLILLDWHMPGMTAHDFLAAFAKKFSAKHTPIIYCTTELDSKDLRLAFVSGITDYIIKPYDRESLQDKITSLPAVAA